MQAPLIEKYTYNSTDSLGLEVSPLDFLWDKAEKSGRTHRANFYQLLWIRAGQLDLTLDFEEVAKQGVAMVYDRVHKVLGEGNFVLTISEGSFAGQAVTFYDLFRVEGGKITEHWDVVEPVLPTDQHQNKNGKFGF